MVPQNSTIVIILVYFAQLWVVVSLTTLTCNAYKAKASAQELKEHSIIWTWNTLLKYAFLHFFVPLILKMQPTSISFHIQPCSKLYIRLLHKPYVNRVTLTRQNLFLKFSQCLEQKSILTTGSRSFQGGTVGLFISKEFKITSCQR